VTYSVPVEKKSKFEDPVGLVSFNKLKEFFNLVNRGCLSCKSPYDSFTVDASGSCIKGQLRCAKHSVSWYSSSVIRATTATPGPQKLTLNSLVPAAAALSGIQQTEIANCLALLGVDTFDAQYQKKHRYAPITPLF
jgi:hypothetical protein